MKVLSKLKRLATFVKSNLKINMLEITNIVKVGTIVIIRVAHTICNLKYPVPKEIPIVFHNWSNYDYHFIINVLAEKCWKRNYFFKRKYWKYITFSVPIETRWEKN